MKIAVIGSGISGIVAAHRLSTTHEVELFEARTRLGGHSHTVTVFEDLRPINIDTGFIVFNTQTYPRFINFLRELGVTWVPSEMSFSVRSDARDFEYNGESVSKVFSQRARALSPRMWQMLRDILRFYRQGKTLLDVGPEVKLTDWLEANNYSAAFVEDHLHPMLRAIWSADQDTADAFPARFLVRFFENHGFLKIGDRPGWLTLPQGSKAYLEAFRARFRGQIHLGTPVTRVTRRQDGVVLETKLDAEPKRFDHIVFACHADQAMKILASPSALESELLALFPYQKNEVVLHTDASLMPKHERTWASWNVHLDEQNANGACLTYWMNQLQPLNAKQNYFVTLNRTHAIDAKQILRTQTFAHPLFTVEGVNAQPRHHELIGHRGISYCGAYWRNGFHEDGVVSAERVANVLDTSIAERAA